MCVRLLAIILLAVSSVRADWTAPLKGLDQAIEMAKKEESREQAKKIETERNATILLDNPETLIPLDPLSKIWVTKDRKAVVIPATVALKKGLLEFFACVKGTKDHESILVLEIKPFLMHAALLVVGAEPGGPAQFSPVFVPPSGDEIDVIVRWKDKDGKRCEAKAQDWVLESEKQKPMSVPWVFTGSVLKKTDEGKTIYMADVTGEIIGLSNFPSSILDVPIASSDSNESLLFSPNTDKIPDVGTQITLILQKHGSQH